MLLTWLVAAVALATGAASAQSTPPVGTRISYHSSSATIQGATGALSVDPDGNYVDPSTGRRYSVQDISGSAAGEGFLQVDITYVDDQVCAGLVTNYTLDRSIGLLLNSSQSGFVTPAGACYEAWIAPARLQAAQLGVTPQGSTVRGHEVVGGQTLDVVRSSVNTSTGSNMTAYDVASGFLLSGSSSSVSTVATPGLGGAVTPAAGRTLLTSTRYLGVRRMHVPANLPPLPQHVQAVRAWHFDCEYGSYGAMITTREWCSLDIDVVSRRPGLLELRVISRIGPSGFASEEASILSSAPVFGAVHVSSEHLRTLTPGQVLDEDPVTGVRTVVVHVDANVVVVARQNTYESIRTTYDLATGWLLESVTEQRIGDAVYFRSVALAGLE